MQLIKKIEDIEKNLSADTTVKVVWDLLLRGKKDEAKELLDSLSPDKRWAFVIASHKHMSELYGQEACENLKLQIMVALLSISGKLLFHNKKEELESFLQIFAKLKEDMEFFKKEGYTFEEEYNLIDEQIENIKVLLEPKEQANKT